MIDVLLSDKGLKLPNLTNDNTKVAFNANQRAALKSHPGLGGVLPHVRGRTGAALGGTLGMLSGLVDPGTETTVDESGRPVLQTKNRLSEMATRGLGGAVVGGAAGKMLKSPVKGYANRVVDSQSPQQMASMRAQHGEKTIGEKVKGMFGRG